VRGSIICGVDGSESAKGAARVARALGRELGLSVVFVAAVERGAGDAYAAAMKERLGHLAAEPGAASSLEAGHPADALVRVAEEVEAALIVVGSTGPRSSLLGSVSAEVSRRASCPVVVVPPGADARVEDAGGAGADRALDVAGGIARFDLGAAAR
jgi:nucleotide-binding universal stress UspA family protein